MCGGYAGGLALRGEAALRNPRIVTLLTAVAALHAGKAIARSRDDNASLPTDAGPSLQSRSPLDCRTETFLAGSGSSTVPIVLRCSEFLLTFALRGETLPLQPTPREGGTGRAGEDRCAAGRAGARPAFSYAVAEALAMESASRRALELVNIGFALASGRLWAAR